MGVDRPVNAQIPDVLMRVADMGRTMYVVRPVNAQIPEVLMVVADNGANDACRSPRQRTNQNNFDGSCG